ncbi:DUF4149 domain-containing protein [Aquabacterium sp. A7-Y]|uniref:DUF4149 domain-containing protein n=1 Tax=Aquabacterium sp. A7-Y TaxID=1349605 RepID=UPI00223DD2FB|nr:DUF4149 domain-containing protein [Aquabacterium sp. A7-Y]MCW7540782.1 DUF4149 domain-containing protein [Aquabacterium sp. A7-Y]
MSLMRLRGWLTGLWAGSVVSVGAIAAPALFAVLERAQAGAVAGRLFTVDAYLGLALAVVLLLLERRLAAHRADTAQGSRMSTELVLVLAVLFCIVAGYFAVQPMMEQARAGQGRWSFGVLHGLSSAFFALKGLLLLVLAWRSAPR